MPAACHLQGDGTAAIFSGRQDVFTLSVHAASNFPARKQVCAVGCVCVWRWGGAGAGGCATSYCPSRLRCCCQMLAPMRASGSSSSMPFVADVCACLPGSLASLQASHLDIALPDGTADNEYLR